MKISRFWLAIIPVILVLGGFSFYHLAPQPQILNPEDNVMKGSVAQIEFSKALPQDEVLESITTFHPEKEVQGYFAWKDEKVLEFHLSESQQLEAFSVVFQRSIKDKLGRPITFPTRLQFFPSPKEGKLTFQVPKAGEKEISGKTPITLMWDQPTFVMQNPKEIAELLKKNITISPEIEGSWQMLGASGLLFEPKDGWIPSTQYTVSFDKEWMDQDIDFSFDTLLPQTKRIQAYELINQKPIVVPFNQDIDLAKIQKHLSILAPGSERLEIDISYDEKTTSQDGKETTEILKNTLRITPRSPWKEATPYRLRINKGAYSLEGPLPQNKILTDQFKSINPFTLNIPSYYTPPRHVRDSITLTSSSSVQSEDLINHLSLSPAPPEEDWTAYKELLRGRWGKGKQSWFTLPPLQTKAFNGWEPNTAYTLSVSEDLTDTYGRKLQKPFSLSFETVYPNDATAIYLPAENSVLTPDAPIELSFGYSGKAPTVIMELSRQINEEDDWHKSYTLPESLDDYTTWKINLRDLFQDPEPKEAASSEDPLPLPVGQYQIKTTFEYPSRVDKNGRKHHSSTRTFHRTFYVSEFGVLLKNEVSSSGDTKRFEISAQHFSGEPIESQEVTIQGFKSNGGYRNYSLSETFNKEKTSLPHIFDNSSLDFVLITLPNSQKGIGSPRFNSKISPYDTKTSFNQWEYQKDYRGVLFADRPLFTPGETVHLKSILRQTNFYGKVFPLKSLDETTQKGWYQLTIRDPFWKNAFSFPKEEEGAFIDLSSFDISWDIPKDSPLGRYQVDIWWNPEGSESREHIGEMSFHVQKFRKPKFLITSQFSEKQALPGDTITAKLDAQYAFGGALSNRPVVYTVSLFGKNCEDYGWYCPQVDKVLSLSSGILDAEGHFELPIILDSEAITPPSSEDHLKNVEWNLLNVDFTVRESDNETSSQTVSLPFYASYYDIKIDRSPYFFSPKEEVTFSGTLQNLDGEGISDHPITATLSKTKWVRSDRKGSDGRFYGEWERTHETIEEKDITSQDKGRFESLFTLPDQGGNYQIRFESADHKDRVTKSHQSFWISGRNPQEVRINEDNKIIELFTDQNEYTTGDKVEAFFPLGDFEITYARATLERGQVLEDIPVNLEDNTISFDTEDWMAPNVYLTLFLQGKNKEGEIDIRYGSVSVSVKDPSRSLNLDVQADQEIYRPGEEVTLTIKTRVQDAATPGEVTIAVVDQTLLALKARPALNLWQKFLTDLPLGVSTSHTLDQFMSSEEMEEVLEMADEASVMAKSSLGYGGGGGGEDHKAGGESKPRGDFKNTAAFLAKVQTDENGEATVTFKAPDNLTTWNVWAVGHTPDNAFGENETTIQTSLPLLISEIVPNFFQVGDEMDIGLLLRRTTAVEDSESEKVTVTLTLPEEIQTESLTQEIDLQKEAYVFFPVTIPFKAEKGLSSASQEIEVQFAIESESGETDSVILRRQLLQPQASLTAAESLKIKSPRVLAFFPKAEESLFSQLSLKVYTSLASKIEPLVTQIMSHNYGCTEQRLTWVTAYLLQDQLLRSLDQKGLEIPEETIKGHQSYIEATFRNGGFRYWKESHHHRRSLWVTAQVLQRASLWEQYGFPFSEDIIEQALTWVKSEIHRSCERRDWYCPSFTTRQHAAYVLAQYERLKGSDLLTLEKKIDTLESKIWWIKTYHLLQAQAHKIAPQSQETYERFWRNLELELQFRDRYAFWDAGRSYFYAQDERLTGLIYPELDHHEALEPHRHKIARYLVETKKKRLSGNTTLQVLEAVIGLAKEESEENKGAQFVIQENNRETKKVTPIAKDTLSRLQDEKLYEKVLQDDRLQTLEFISKNDKAYYSDVELLEVFPALKTGAIEKGFWIERGIYALEDKDYETPLTELQVGKNYRVRLRIATNSSHRQVIVEDFIPAGTEIVNFVFDNANQTLNDDRNASCRWWCRPAFAHQEFHHEKARFFANYFSSGTHQVEYTIQARLPGTFETPPAIVQEMYFPEVMGRSNGSQIKITK